MIIDSEASDEISESRAELQKIIDQVRVISGSFRRDPLQLVLIIMFAGVIIVGIWHGMVVERQTEAILEVTEVIKNARK